MTSKMQYPGMLSVFVCEGHQETVEAEANLASTT